MSEGCKYRDMCTAYGDRDRGFKIMVLGYFKFCDGLMAEPNGNTCPLYRDYAEVFRKIDQNFAGEKPTVIDPRLTLVKKIEKN